MEKAVRSYGIGSKQPVILDSKNGYLKITTPPNDGVIIGDIEIAIFKNEKKEDFIAVHEKQGSNDGSTHRLNIVQVKNNKFIKANKQCLHELKPELFLNRNFIAKKYLKREFKNMFGEFKLFQLKYKLPRYGTKLKVAVYTDNLDLPLDDNENNELIRKIIQEYRKSIEHREIILEWDRRYSKFTIAGNGKRRK